MKNAKGILHGLRVLRRNLPLTQFMHVLTSQSFLKIYYGASVWLPSLTQVDIHRVDRIHYRAIQVGIHDFKNQVSKESLDRDFKRATPSEWGDYCSAQEMIRVFNSINVHRHFSNALRVMSIS
jgi:hypothetical protein